MLKVADGCHQGNLGSKGNCRPHYSQWLCQTLSFRLNRRSNHAPLCSETDWGAMAEGTRPPGRSELYVWTEGFPWLQAVCVGSRKPGDGIECPLEEPDGQSFLSTELAGMADMGISEQGNCLLFASTMFRETGLCVHIFVNKQTNKTKRQEYTRLSCDLILILM